MSKKLEKTYREMREALNEGTEKLDEVKQGNSGSKTLVDDDPKVEAEDQGRQKKGGEPTKPAANRPADSKKKGLGSESGETSKGKKVGLREAKKAKKKNEGDNPFDKKDDDDEDEDDIEESKETSADRKKRGVPPKGKLEEAKAKAKAKGANRRADITEEGDDDDDDDDEDMDEAAHDDDDDDDDDMDEAADDDDDDDDDDDKDKIAEAEDKKLEDELAETTEKAVADMGDLLEGQASLNEDHKEQVKTLFEAALSDKTKVIRTNLQEQHERKLAEAIDVSETELIGSLNTYLDKVIVEWLDENRMELEQSIRTEITESFLGAMKTVFDDHYVDVPDEKLDLVENILDENEEMEEKLNEEMIKRMEAEKALETYKKSEVIDSLSGGMTLTEKERLVELTEEISYTDEKSFTKKATTIKENFFKEAPKSDDVEILNEDAHVEDTNQSDIAKRYGGTIKHMSKDRFSMRDNRKDK